VRRCPVRSSVAKRAFEDFSQSVVGAAAPIATAFLPALTGVLDKIGPKLQSFASKVPEVVKVFTESFKSHGNDVTTQGFLGKIGTKDDVAPSIGNLAVILQGPLQVAITAVVVAFRLAGAVLANVIGPALKSVTGWMKDHQAIVKAVALSVGTVVVAWKLWQGAILLWQAATKAAIAVQTAFNVVLDANPIGLVIVAIAGMAAGLIYAYKNCDGFRHVVQETFNWIRDHWKLLVQIIGLPMEPLIQLALHFTEFKRIAQEALRKVVDSFLDMVGAILHTAASMFGWVPKVGDHLKGARDAFDRFRDSVNASLGGIQSNKKITVTATAVLTDGSGAPISDTSGYSAYARAHKDGGPIFGPGSGTSDSIFARLSNGEYVVRAAQASQHRGLLDAINYGAPGFAQGGPVVVPNASAAMFARQTSAWDNSLGARVSGAFSGMLERFAASFSAGIGSGVQRWSGLVSQVLSMLGLSPGLLGKVLAQMTTESGGNVSAINLTDSNALAGHPSQGLMQVIPGTFAAYAGPYAGLGILNPLANVYAGLNYAMHRYGPGLAGLGEGHGYDSGGWLKPGVSLTYNGTGKPEAVLTSEQWRSVRSGGHTFVIQTMDAASLQQWINRPGNPGILIDAMDRHKGRGSSVPAWMS
jgi:hypothetical protein